MNAEENKCKHIIGLVYQGGGDWDKIESPDEWYADGVNSDNIHFIYCPLCGEKLT